MKFALIRRFQGRRIDDDYLVKHLFLHLSFPLHSLYAFLVLLCFDLSRNENKRKLNLILKHRFLFYLSVSVCYCLGSLLIVDIATENGKIRLESSLWKMRPIMCSEPTRYRQPTQRASLVKIFGGFKSS